jgi:hypothetical protein
VDLPSEHPFRPLSVMADDWVARAEARLAADPGRFGAGLAREGLALFCELSRHRADRGAAVHRPARRQRVIPAPPVAAHRPCRMSVTRTTTCCSTS